MSKMAQPKKSQGPAFTVDTKLFHELGELLVAKESTALVELIKNAYDADATVVTVLGDKLDDPAAGKIIVKDDGLGMSSEEFENGFLRIAGRSKLTKDRRSPVFGRRYTGEKGVGRLAAHKLATKVEVLSRKSGAASRGASELPPAVSGFKATINWARIEEVETFDQIPSSGALKIEALPVKPGVSSGTRLALSPLRRTWSERMKNTFLKEAVTLSPTPVLWQRLPDGLVREPLLFKTVPIRDQLSSDPGFRIEFGGDLAVPDLMTPDVAQAADWIAELEYDRDSGLLQLVVAPTTKGLERSPTAEGYRYKNNLGPAAGPSFRARILQQSRRVWDPAVQGIRVFMEGFRVPPYGDLHDDWLDLERTYKSRAKRQLSSLSTLSDANFPPGHENEELVVQGNSAYMGGIFLNRASSPELNMLVNREGFLPGEGLEFLAKWTRIATDLIVRLGYAARQEVREITDLEREKQKRAAQMADVGETPAAARVRESAVAAQRQLEVVHDALREKKYEEAARAAKMAQPYFEDVRTISYQFGSEAVMWRVMASLGIELAAFVHEINAIALQAGRIVADLDEALSGTSLSGVKPNVRRARMMALDLAERIKRNATYLVDATSFQGRRRRTRQPLHERFEAVVPFFKTRIEQKKITLENAIANDIRTPPMFPAELSGIFTNLLSNAVKFTNPGGRIRIDARNSKEFMIVRMENTGAAVDLRNSKRLFDAFQSTTDRPDAILGQGMGMGLTITRAFVQEYGGSIDFVAPSKGFQTAIEFSIPCR